MMEKRPKIAIVDDATEDREVFRRYLLQDINYRYHFYEAETGETGLELCQRIQPDCILLDYNLPDMTGLEFLEELADEKGSVPFTVIMLTGIGNETVALQAMQKGAQDYLVKDEMTAGNLFRGIHSAIERSTLMHTMEKQRQALEKKNQEVEAFAYALAHDLRAPLRAISGFTQILARDYTTSLDEKGHHYMTTIVRACGQMDRLIEELLMYTRIEHRPRHWKPVSVENVLRQIVSTMHPRLVEIGSTVTIGQRFPMVYGDQMLVNQIFMNLLENAVTYVRPGVASKVTVDWKRDGKSAVIGVRDNGIGIAARHYEKIFQIFQRLHSDEEYAGTGIGLAIVKKATELMGGSVQVESVPGEGSCFFVKLPIYDWDADEVEGQT